ncbi:hypothetical protein SAMN05421743_105198 [Thalassobacillus cyri]|uniref:Uncharacterized protein n=1 Tax=Thalassobacillus cyri TaxID=571932 RepID=A0A1H4BYQ6_9BACI|nr:hypothetical protein [Thalassobacillus cyri]SEA53246.1 hypothetical protein SAMN05421743_105198 [Thalassobacillus cyri]
MCELCQGKGKIYFVNQSSVGFMPCPYASCREKALKKSDQAIQDIKRVLRERKGLPA